MTLHECADHGRRDLAILIMMVTVAFLMVSKKVGRLACITNNKPAVRTQLIYETGVSGLLDQTAIIREGNDPSCGNAESTASLRC
jgi:hypothetical protein